jgi:putative ABC transport system permease protein
MKRDPNGSSLWGERLLRLVLPGLDAESVAGDIQEGYRDLAAGRGPLYARVWYGLQVLRAIISGLSVRLYWTGTMARAHLKMTLRTIRRQKVYSLINLTGLAVGMAVCILILLWVRHEMSYDRFHENLDSLHRLVLRSEDGGWYDTVMVGLIPGLLEDEYPEVEHASNLGRTERKLAHRKQTFIGQGLRVDPGFLHMFSFPLRAGDPATALDTPRSIVITEELAQKLMGGKEALGQVIWIDDRVSLKVSGVIGDLPKNSSIQFDFLVPYVRAGSIADHWGWKDVQEAYVLLRKDTSLPAMNAKIAEIYNDRKPEGNPRQTLFLQPMRRLHLYAPNGGGLITYVTIFSVMAGIILLIACINFINLATACSENRFKEIGIKKVVGSGRFQLVRQFLSEYLLLSFISLFLALLLVQLLLPSVGTLVGQDLRLRLTGTILLLFAGIALVTGIVSGAFPALFLSSFDPVSIIRGRFRMGGKAMLRKFLVVTQFALSILFIIGTLVVSRQMEFIRDKDLGFQKEQVLKIPVRGQLGWRFPAVKARLLEIPAVEAVTISTYDMVFWNASSASGWYDEGGLRKAILGTAWVGYDFLDTLKIDLFEGRFFSRDFPSDIQDAYVINRAAVRVLGLKQPVGTRLIRSVESGLEDPGVIVGVVEDFHTQSLREEVRPFMLVLAPRGTGNQMFIRARAGGMPETVAAVEDAVREVIPNYPVSVRFLDEMVDDLYRHEHLTGDIINWITGLAVFLSCLGLLGLASFTIKKRTKEIGIRKVLGSSMAGIAVLFMKDFMKWVVLANLLAWPVAWYALDRWLQRFAYRTDLSWQIFPLSGLIALGIALATVYVHSLRAARADPVKSLRYE